VSRHSIKVFRWRSNAFKVGNFGDEITIPLIERLWGMQVVPTSVHTADIIGAGSILDMLSRPRALRWTPKWLLNRLPDLHVWGSGFLLADSEAYWLRPLKVHSVRGRLSAARLPGFRGPVGDPGILADRLLDKLPPQDTEVVFVPHYVDERLVASLELPRFWKVAHTDAAVLDVVTAIAASEIVVSSSLHGLIVADALGKPAIWARSANGLHTGSDYKFYDHASARGCEFNAPLAYDQLVGMKVKALRGVATVPKVDLAQWQEDVMSAFPFN